MLSKVGEIIEESTGEFMAQCYELHQPPPFGSLVMTREGEVPRESSQSRSRSLLEKKDR